MNQELENLRARNGEPPLNHRTTRHGRDSHAASAWAFIVGIVILVIAAVLDYIVTFNP